MHSPAARDSCLARATLGLVPRVFARRQLHALAARILNVG